MRARRAGVQVSATGTVRALTPGSGRPSVSGD